MPESIPAALRPMNRTAAKTARRLSADDTGSLPSEASAVQLRLLKRSLAAATLSLSVRTLDKLTQQGKIRSVQIGDRRLYRPADLDDFVASFDK